MILSANTIAAEGLGDFFKNPGKKWLNVSKGMAKNLLKNPGIASEIGANVGTAFASRSLGAALSSLPELIVFYRPWKKLNLGKFVWFYAILMERKTPRLFPSEPLENNDLEQRLGRKLNNVNGFNNPINHKQEMITYFKDKNNKSKKEFKKVKCYLQN